MKDKDLGAAHTGFHDWYWQRISAIALLLLLPSLFALLLAIYTGYIDFFTLNKLVTHPLGKIASTLLVLSLAMHLWTGLKVIIEDYIHSPFQRGILLNILLLCIAVASMYAGYHIWAEVSYNFSCLPCEHGLQGLGEQ